MNASFGPMIDPQTDALLRRIQEVEQEIAALREERAHRGASDEQARIAELEGLVGEAEKQLLAVKATRLSARAPMSPIASARLGLYALGGVLGAGGLFSTWTAWHFGAEPLLIATAAAPALIGVFMVVRTYSAKSLDDVLGKDQD